MQRRTFSLVAPQSFVARRFATSAATATASLFCRSVLFAQQQQQQSVVVPTTMMSRRFSSARSSLNDQTNSEIQGEESNNNEPEPQVPAGWSVNHTVGTNYFTAKKSFGDETLNLYCPLRSPRATTASREAGNEHGEAAQPFSVLINRSGNKASMFVNLSVVGGELVVDQIRMLDGPVGENDALNFHREIGDKFAVSYEGPGIFELEEPFADPLFSFLEERGLSDDFAEFVALYAYHTEQREYINWLQKLATFTA